MAGFLLFYPAMRGISRNIAILLALCLLAMTGVAGRAEARGGGGKLNAAAVKLSRGAKIKLDRMKQKLSRTTRGAERQRSTRLLRLGNRRLVGAMGQREGLGGSESERTRARIARDADQPGERKGETLKMHEQGKFLRDRRDRTRKRVIVNRRRQQGEN